MQGNANPAPVNVLNTINASIAGSVSFNGGQSVGLTHNTASSGVATFFKQISAAGTNATLIKAGASVFNDVMVTNTHTAVIYLKLYNKATTPTVGTDTPIKTIPVLPNQTLPINCGFGWRCPLGLGMATTLGAADSDTATIPAGVLITNISYA